MKKLLVLFIIIFSFKAFCHPVIYKGGLAVSSSNMPDYSNNYILYSPSQKFALGAEHWRMTKNEKNNEMGLMKTNYLLWRHNGEDSQANIYLHAGLGVEDQEFSRKVTRGTYLVGAEGDCETRTLYASLKHYQFPQTYLHQARIGFSPKETPFDQLQSWFMIQGMYIKDVKERYMITPMVRFFYHNLLWEFGSSTRGEWMLNLMVHY
jgi:hypothetical protein